MATQNPGSPDPVRSAAAAAVSPDPVTAELLEKHTAGEKLNQSQYGKLGAYAAKLKNLNPFGRSDKSGSPTGNPPAVGAIPAGSASGDSLDRVAVDSLLAQRTTAALLKRGDILLVRWAESWAREAGADDRTVGRTRDQASLSKDDRDLISELSPDILQELGIDPRKFPMFTALAVIGLHGTNLWLLRDDMKRIAAERAESEAQRAPKAGPSTTPVPPVPVVTTGIMSPTATTKKADE
jgi:hypothetical protein